VQSQLPKNTNPVPKPLEPVQAGMVVPLPKLLQHVQQGVVETGEEPVEEGMVETGEEGMVETGEETGEEGEVEAGKKALEESVFGQGLIVGLKKGYDTAFDLMATSTGAIFLVGQNPTMGPGLTKLVQKKLEVHTGTVSSLITSA